MLLQMSAFHYFWWLSSIPLYTTSLSLPLVSGCLGCLHVLTTVNSEAVNVVVHVYFKSEFSPDTYPGLLDHTAILFLVCFCFFCLRNVFIVFHHVCGQSLSHFRLFATPWTVAHQAPLSMGFSRQEHWRGLPFPSPHLKNIQATPTAQFQKNKWPNQKMGQRTK